MVWTALYDWITKKPISIRTAGTDPWLELVTVPRKGDYIMHDDRAFEVIEVWHRAKAMPIALVLETKLQIFG